MSKQDRHAERAARAAGSFRCKPGYRVTFRRPPGLSRKRWRKMQRRWWREFFTLPPKWKTVSSEHVTVAGLPATMYCAKDEYGRWKIWCELSQGVETGGHHALRLLTE